MGTIHGTFDGKNNIYWSSPSSVTCNSSRDNKARHLMVTAHVSLLFALFLGLINYS